MEYTKVIDDGTCKISIIGRFVFADHSEFKKIIALLSEESMNRLELDLSGVEFVDSAALGLFLLLKDETEKSKIALQIIRPKGQVQKMFRISRFYELFNIVD